MIATLKLAISFIPAPIQVMLLAIIGLLVVIAVFRLIAMVLDAIPFL